MSPVTVSPIHLSFTLQGGPFDYEKFEEKELYLVRLHTVTVPMSSIVLGYRNSKWISQSLQSTGTKCRENTVALVKRHAHHKDLLQLQLGTCSEQPAYPKLFQCHFPHSSWSLHCKSPFLIIYWHFLPITIIPLPFRRAIFFSLLVKPFFLLLGLYTCLFPWDRGNLVPTLFLGRCLHKWCRLLGSSCHTSSKPWWHPPQTHFCLFFQFSP